MKWLFENPGAIFIGAIIIPVLLAIAFGLYDLIKIRQQRKEWYKKYGMKIYTKDKP